MNNSNNNNNNNNNNKTIMNYVNENNIDLNDLKNINTINYNNNTKHIEHWNPYLQNIDISFFENKSFYFILGPKNENKLRYLWKFNIKYNTNNNEFIFYSTENSKNLDPCININIKNKIAKINYINKCGNYTGRDLIKWMLDIIEKLGCQKCILLDQAEKKCNNRDYSNYVPISLIHKLWRGKTYYEHFNFIPYKKKNNNNNLKNIIMLDELNNNIKNLQDLHWSDFNIDDNNSKWKLFKKNYFFYKSPFLAFQEFSQNNCGIFYDIIYLLEKNNNIAYENIQRIRQILSKSIWIKEF